MENKPDTNALIRRLITNQRYEHAPHAFRAGHAGMHDFNRLVPLLRGLPETELHTWLDLIDSVAATHAYCECCFGKILAYCVLITKAEPSMAMRHRRYKELYAICADAKPEAEPRDYMKEVLDSMYHGKEHARRQTHVQHWHELADTLDNIGRHQSGKNGPGLSGSSLPGKLSKIMGANSLREEEA
jgi:hypothetical protein